MSLPLSTRLLLLLLLVISSSSISHAQQPSKEALAEQAADRIVKRFFETLDFETIYREFYVRDEKLRQAEVRIIASNLLFQGDPLRQRDLKPPEVDFATMERVYIAQSNFHWVPAAAVWTFEGDEDKYKVALEAAYKKYYKPLTDMKNWPMRTNKQVEELLLPAFNGMTTFFRGYVVKENFGSAKFKRKEAAFEESTPPDSLDELKALFSNVGVKKSDFWYVARRAEFYIYLVEEGGEFRMLSYKSRVRF